MGEAKSLAQRLRSEPTVPEVGAGAPDPAACRAESLSNTPDLVDCLTRPIIKCPFHVAYGHGGFCRHPERERIIERTRAAEQSPTAPGCQAQPVAGSLAPLLPANQSHEVRPG